MQTTKTSASIERKSQDWLEPLWSKIGDEPHYPLNTSEVLVLARAAGYDCTARHISHWIATGQIPKLPVKGSGPTGVTGKAGTSRKWRANDVITLFAKLESMRYWLPGHCNERKSLFHIEYEKNPQQCRAELFPALERFSVYDLLVLATTEKQPVEREALFWAIRLKLEQQGVDIKDIKFEEISDDDTNTTTDARFFANN